MTRQTMLGAAARLPRSPSTASASPAPATTTSTTRSAGTTSPATPTGPTPNWWRLAVTGDDHVLVTTPNHEAPQMSPIVRAASHRGHLHAH